MRTRRGRAHSQTQSQSPQPSVAVETGSDSVSGRRRQLKFYRHYVTVTLVSSCFLFLSNQPVPVEGFLCPAKPIPRCTDIRAAGSSSQSQATNLVEDNGRKNQLWQSNHSNDGSSKDAILPNEHDINHSENCQHKNNNNNNHNNNISCEEDQVHEWLWQSTSLILGEELTLKLVKGGTDTATKAEAEFIPTSRGEIMKVPSQFPTDEDFMLNAESVMRAWCQWISRFSNNDGNNVHLSYDDGVIRCSAINAANVVDAILNRVIGVIDECQVFVGEEQVVMVMEDMDCSNGSMGEEGTEWEAKLVELVNCAIDAWANTKNRDGEAVKRAAEWLTYLQQMLNQQEQEEDRGDHHLMMSESERNLYSCLSDDVLKLFEESYRGVIKACIRSHERRHLRRAMELLDELRLSLQQNTSLTDDVDSGGVLYPSTHTYNLVLYGLANCEPCEGNARKAEQLLDEMASPDSNTFRQVIIAWTKSGAGAAAAENARRVLDQMLSDFPMLDPDASTFNAIMTLYIKLGKTKETLAVFDLMSSMHQSGRSGTEPDIYSVNLMLNAMTKQPPYLTLEDIEAVEQLLENMEERLVCPDVNSYNLVIDAWAKSDLREAGERAESLLDRMEAKARHDQNAAPDGYSFTSTINAIERSRHHKARGTWAEKVFNRMKDLNSQGLVEKPTTPVYNALLNALISSQEEGALTRAEALFLDMETDELANSRTYNTMLKGYAMFCRSNTDGRVASPAQPRKAERLLDEMEYSHFTKGKNSAIIPDKYSYTTVISAYGRSNAKRKAANAQMILHRMIDSYNGGNSAARPGTFAFNAVLNACAHTRYPEERLESFTILCSTLILQREWAKPDHTTYATFLQACARLLPRDEARKWRVVETVFNSCIREGQCGELVLKNLKGVASPGLYEALVGRFVTDDGLDIPLQWRRNVAG